MKRRAPAPPSNPDRWQGPYSIFMTLLFALFVVLYAGSQADAEKFKQLAESLKRGFGRAPVTEARVTPDTERSEPEEAQPEAQRVSPRAGADLVPAQERIEEILRDPAGGAEIRERISVRYVKADGALKITVLDLFEQGHAEARPSLAPWLERIGRAISKDIHPIRIEGHTDLSEAELEDYPSDWELSAARAAWLSRFWIKRSDVAAERMSIVGHSHFRGGKLRTANRRIEIAVLESSSD